MTVADLVELQDYLIGVIGRADHHEQTVDEIVLALVGTIVLTGPHVNATSPGTQPSPGAARQHAPQSPPRACTGIFLPPLLRSKKAKRLTGARPNLHWGTRAE